MQRTVLHGRRRTVRADHCGCSFEKKDCSQHCPTSPSLPVSMVLNDVARRRFGYQPFTRRQAIATPAFPPVAKTPELFCVDTRARMTQDRPALKTDMTRLIPR